MDVLFENATVITMEENDPCLKNAYVAVRGKEIAYVGDTAPDGDFARRIDARGKVLMPGLINAHTHVPMSMFRGMADDYSLKTWLEKYIFPAEDKLCAEDVYAGACLGIAEMIAFGTTSFSDSYFFTDAIADAAIESGIKANLARSLVGDGADFENYPAALQMCGLKEKIHMYDGGRLRVDASIHAEYTTETALRERVAQYAADNGLILQIHMSESEDEHRNCVARYGKTPARLFLDEGLFQQKTLLAHCCHVTEDDMDILASVGASVAHCPVSNLKLASGIAPIVRMREKGINVALGTDGVASNNNADLFEEIKLAAVLHKAIAADPTVIRAYDALYMATVGGATAQGRDDCGRIKVGYDADIILLDFDKPHLTPCRNAISSAVYSARGSDVVLTMVSGKILYENGVFTTIDIERAKSAVAQMVKS